MLRVRPWAMVAFVCRKSSEYPVGMLASRLRKLGLLLPMLLLLACTAPDGGRASEGSESGGEEATPPPAQPPQEDFWLGEPREDIDRFVGVYGDAGNPEQAHGAFFVAPAKRPPMAERAPEIPVGYLMIGAMWGDVAPWYMKSLSEATFQQVTQGDFGPPETIVVEFQFGDDGKAEALLFKSGMDRYDRRVRIGDLPEEWQE